MLSDFSRELGTLAEPKTREDVDAESRRLIAGLGARGFTRYRS
jgi:hypothetical protein